MKDTTIETTRQHAKWVLHCMENTDDFKHLSGDVRDTLVSLANTVLRLTEPPVEHNVTAEPVEKFDGGIVGYRFRCSCGKEGHGHHSTERKAVIAGHDHFGGTYDGQS